MPIKPITVKETLAMQRMRKALEMMQHNVITYADLRAVCPRDDERADLVARLLAGGFVSATLYPVNPGSEAAHGC
ncbi:hypothetical protein [Pseudodesulfovibrio sp.]|uniref:hypothetical protein n=1 Tax=Pseudodesulfovibrio sp. TaxID=2035812 RepID=UPI002621CDC2|nr:hypothetical protein [Pseudodesulfovibrio sp.]MDD3310979.1 hypothetical protein [Pseudodesulfovibrio sp.]